MYYPMEVTLVLIIPGAVHPDLYDDVASVIPYDKIEASFNLKRI